MKVTFQSCVLQKAIIIIQLIDFSYIQTINKIGCFVIVVIVISALQ